MLTFAKCGLIIERQHGKQDFIEQWNQQWVKELVERKTELIMNDWIEGKKQSENIKILNQLEQPDLETSQFTGQRD